MRYAPTADDAALIIPAPPRRAARAAPRREDWPAALREASLAGLLTLSASWALAELAFLAFG